MVYPGRRATFVDVTRLTEEKWVNLCDFGKFNTPLRITYMHLSNFATPDAYQGAGLLAFKHLDDDKLSNSLFA